MSSTCFDINQASPSEVSSYLASMTVDDFKKSYFLEQLMVRARHIPSIKSEVERENLANIVREVLLFGIRCGQPILRFSKSIDNPQWAQVVGLFDPLLTCLTRLLQMARIYQLSPDFPDVSKEPFKRLVLEITLFLTGIVLWTPDWRKRLELLERESQPVIFGMFNLSIKITPTPEEWRALKQQCESLLTPKAEVCFAPAVTRAPEIHLSKSGAHEAVAADEIMFSPKTEERLNQMSLEFDEPLCDSVNPKKDVEYRYDDLDALLCSSNEGSVGVGADVVDSGSPILKNLKLDSWITPKSSFPFLGHAEASASDSKIAADSFVEQSL